MINRRNKSRNSTPAASPLASHQSVHIPLAPLNSRPASNYISLSTTQYPDPDPPELQETSLGISFKMYYTKPAYITYAATLFGVIVFLNLLFTGNGQQFNVGAFLTQTTPYMWAVLGCAFSVGLSVIGAAW